ncbi:MAG: 23S rRNA (pseudouridine(1915)-N(3))-methyltransferase RlmH [Acholeplasmataceae bacterium]|nr:23S rRNA (pseudouridine(1915)-N(3))-methyltransferase RlmH [Acholeplasmataceae bacterium]
MIKIIAVGKISQKYLDTGISYYLKQIPHKIEIIEVKDEANIQGIDAESERILSKIKIEDYVCLLAIQGKMEDSESFAKFIDDKLTYQSGDLVFIIGGSHGVNDSIFKRSNAQLSFSKMTFPHQLMRLMLIEQIYRGFMILKGHPYHK